MLSLIYDHLWWIIGGSVIIVIAIIIRLSGSKKYSWYSDDHTFKRHSQDGAQFKERLPDGLRPKKTDRNIILSGDILIQGMDCQNAHISHDQDSYKYPTIEKPEWYEILQEELCRLPMGKIVFNPPDVMKLGIKDRIEARITRDIHKDLLVSLKGRGVPQSEQLKISELMKVRLSGNDFNIISLNEEEQIIEKTGFTEWAWDITPKDSGKKVLHLHVTLRIRLPFGEERKDHPVLDREIVVKVNPVYSVKVFLVSHWKWIVTALMLPLIGLVWKLYTLSFGVG